jgi:hypothetical protein
VFHVSRDFRALVSIGIVLGIHLGIRGDDDSGATPASSPFDRFVFRMLEVHAFGIRSALMLICFL